MIIFFVVFGFLAISKAGPAPKRHVVCNYGEFCDDACESTICEYNWIIAERHSTTWRTVDHADDRIKEYAVDIDEKQAKVNVRTNRFYSKAPKGADGKLKGPEDELRNIQMLDGREERRIITINNHFPGPVIRVRKGAAVIVNVKNEMPIQAATVHWHGILMTNNFWMDGAAFINQCPILPHQQFTYSWKAENAGTFWYHTHLANQRMDGIFGGIIIHDQHAHTPGIPLVLFDWFQTNSLDIVTSNPFGKSGTGMAHCNHAEESFTKGVKVSSLCMDSILVNGHGQWRNPQNYSEASSSILETYEVPETEPLILVHVIHGGFEFPIKFYRHDRQKFTVVETDGGELEEVQVDDIVIGIGETYVICLPATWRGDLYLRAELMVECKGYQCKAVEVPFADIVIRRSSATEVIRPHHRVVTPLTEVKRPLDEICTDLRPCVTLNCPWGRYPKLDKANKYKYHTCKTIDSLRRTRRPSASHVETYSPHKDDKIDHLLNVTFNFAVGSSINNIKFKYPNRPLYEGAKYLEECEFESLYDVPTEGAECTQVIHVKKDQIVEIRFVGAENPRADRRRLMWTYHTAHLHGHDMFLIDMGFPETYKNGSIKSMSKFLKCDNPACTMHQWKEDKIAKRVNFDRPIQKNTILLPAQGYAIVRFKATNPGWWPLHCHNALHNMEGMMLLFHVDDEEHGRPLTTIPRGLPQCSPQQSSRRAEQLYPWEIEPNFNW